MQCPDCGKSTRCPCCGKEGGVLRIGIEEDLIVHSYGPMKMRLLGADGDFSSGMGVCITSRRGLPCQK